MTVIARARRNAKAAQEHRGGGRGEALRRAVITIFMACQRLRRSRRRARVSILHALYVPNMRRVYRTAQSPLIYPSLSLLLHL